MLCNVDRKICTVSGKQVDIEDHLIVLNSGVFTGFTFDTQGFQKIPYVRFAILFFVEFNFIYQFSFGISNGMMIYMLANFNRRVI